METNKATIRENAKLSFLDEGYIRLTFYGKDSFILLETGPSGYARILHRKKGYVKEVTRSKCRTMEATNLVTILAEGGKIKRQIETQFQNGNHRAEHFEMEADKVHRTIKWTLENGQHIVGSYSPNQRILRFYEGEILLKSIITNLSLVHHRLTATSTLMKKDEAVYTSSSDTGTDLSPGSTTVITRVLPHHDSGSVHTVYTDENGTHYDFSETFTVYGEIDGFNASMADGTTVGVIQLINGGEKTIDYTSFDPATGTSVDVESVSGNANGIDYTVITSTINSTSGEVSEVSRTSIADDGAGNISIVSVVYDNQGGYTLTIRNRDSSGTVTENRQYISPSGLQVDPNGNITERTDQDVNGNDGVDLSTGPNQGDVLDNPHPDHNGMPGVDGTDETPPSHKPSPRDKALGSWLSKVGFGYGIAGSGKDVFFPKHTGDPAPSMFADEEGDFGHESLLDVPSIEEGRKIGLDIKPYLYANKEKDPENNPRALIACLETMMGNRAAGNLKELYDVAFK